jgi:hypothetical protein
MVNAGIFNDHLECFIFVWYNSWPFGIVCGHLVYFFQFGVFGPRKIWQPWTQDEIFFVFFFIIIREWGTGVIVLNAELRLFKVLLWVDVAMFNFS